MPRSLTDLFKVIAAVAVVGIHATSLSETRFAAAHNFDSLDFLSVVVNQWARFSVPLFIYFSGYGLTISQKQTEDIGLFKTWLAFLGRRLPTILRMILLMKARLVKVQILCACTYVKWAM